MSERANKDLVIRLIERVWNAGKVELLPQLWAEDTRADALALHQVLTEAFPDLWVEIEELVAGEDRVVARLRLHGTHRGEFLGAEPTHRPVTLTAIRIYRIAGGRIVEALADQDAMGLLQQLREAEAAPGS
ncbi:ester cyclase [Amycolatopsis aidingensis]|uniref:ester cyclase n=1 Tax=Amycolatopsis aidingensis TaxID=2842453 RepID=UPI001C0D0DEB|nr:ester cyclase [Amycolatopsis aidingensis]